MTTSDSITASAFAREIARILPEEKPYDFHKRLSTSPVHIPRRNAESRPDTGEIAIDDEGWTLLWNPTGSPVLENAVHDFLDYLATSMQIAAKLETRNDLPDVARLDKSIVVATRDQLPQHATRLKGPKDYAISVSPDRITVCGYDERGAMYGLYHLESRMNLREAPFLPRDLDIVRHSLYDTRMVQSWMGWLEWPDTLLSHLAHDGFDAIFASCYANPNGDRTTAENSTEFYARLLYRIRHQDPAWIRDLIDRAARFGIKVYTPIIYQYLGTPESEDGLRRLVRDILRDFPDIQGYILLTEGFWYKKWGGHRGASKEHLQDWARNWSKAVGIVAEECHRMNPDIEILPWEYNIDFRPQNVDMKRYFVQQLPQDTIPLLTWENGKSFELDGMQGYLRDYSINEIGPAEVADAQIDEAHRRGMKVYCKADTFATWQFGTTPYLPFPYQWAQRYRALENHGVNGTLESHSSGYTPNFITELRAWHCWTDAPPLDELLGDIAAREFGPDARESVLEAWNLFSQAIRLVPDTGPRMGTNAAVGNPLFFEEPPPRTATFTHSWSDPQWWTGHQGSRILPLWPFTVFYLTFIPDFTNRTNQAELYARTASGVETDDATPLLPIFLRRLCEASELMEKGLEIYRTAALRAPEPKRPRAVREVMVAEHIQRMLQSNHAILQFEDLRIRHAAEENPDKANALLDHMEQILTEEVECTELSLLAAERDSRFGFQFEQDYVYTPYSLKEKLRVLEENRSRHLPDARR